MFNIDCYNVEDRQAHDVNDISSFDKAEDMAARFAQTWEVVEVRHVTFEDGVGHVIAEWVDGVRTV